MNEKNIPALIKYYRSLCKMSQADLGKASEINTVQIKQYEEGRRNPKIDQINKIAEALNVSSNAFLDNNVNAIGDIMAYIIALDEQTDFTINCEKDEDGNYLPETLSFSFKNINVNKRIVEYLKYKESVYDTTNQDEKLQFYLNNIDNNTDN